MTDVQTASDSAGSAPNWVMPAETDPHERTLMCWPARPQIWGRSLRQAQLDYAEIAHAISRFEPVTMICRPEAAELAADMCGSEIDICEIPIDDSWCRDSGPIYVTNARGERAIADFRFNAWGEKFLPYTDDAALVARWHEANGAGLGVERLAYDMVLEGGALTVDGLGTLVTTQQTLMHPNRNPQMTRAHMESVLHQALGISTVIWLPYGLALDDDTDGHVDNVAAFAGPGLLVMQGCSDTDEDDWLRMETNRRWAQDALDAQGHHLDVLAIPVLPFTELDDERLCVPYLNYYVANGAVFVPVCGHAADDEMLAMIGSAYPERTVVPVPGTTLAYGGGGPHCITQQVPATAHRTGSLS
jgi:agmatine deiminase